MKKICIAPILLLFLLLLCFKSEFNVKAKEVVVYDFWGLVTELQDMTEDTKITLDPNFDVGMNYSIEARHESDFNLTLDMNHVNITVSSVLAKYGSGDFIIENYLMDGSDVSAGMENRFVSLRSYSKEGLFIFKNAKLIHNRGIYEPTLNVDGPMGEVVIDNVLFEDNESYKGAAVAINTAKVFVKIMNTTFKNNETKNAGAAISTSEYFSKLAVENTKFENNRIRKTTDEQNQGAGAIFLGKSYSQRDVTIRNSIFKDNNASNSNDKIKPIAGAISAEDFKIDDSIKISGTTFYRNEGEGGGGAISLNSADPGASDLILENNTFYQNSSLSNGAKLSNGGALLIYSENDESLVEVMTQTMFARNNSFLDNKMIKNKDSVGAKNVKGGAIGLENTYVPHKYFNNLLVGNHLENNDLQSKAYENVFNEYNEFVQEYNLGFDNGIDTKHSKNQIYGKYPIVLTENHNTVRAGHNEDAEVIPTIMIAPKIMNSKGIQFTGLANMAGMDATNTDQRGYKRLGKPDIGAVEISSLVYDAAGGRFKLPELTKYDGETYYEGENPQQYAKVDIPGAEYTVLDGKKVLKPIRENHVFLGWSLKKGAKIIDPSFAPGKKLKIEDQTVLYAVWKENKYSLKYFSNGKTSGIVPTQKQVNTTTEITIKSVGKMKRKGYKFSGWSTKPSAKKGEAAYAPGKKLKLVKNTKLYAIWKR